MGDNGDTIIDYSDLTWDSAGGFYRFDLTSNRDHLTLSDGLGLVHVFGHGYDIYGSGFAGIDLNDTNYGIWLWDFDITGEFTYGVTGQNLDGSLFYEVDVINANVQAYNIEGDSITIAYPDIANIGADNYQGVVGGMALQGSGYTIYGANIWSLHSAYEAYAVGFNSINGTDNLLAYSSLNGTGSTNWTFGIWSSNAYDSVTVDNVTATDWTWGSGGLNTVNWHNSTVTVANGGNNAAYAPSSTVTESVSSAFTFNGTAGHDALIGDASNQSFYGGPGYDAMQGGAGNDTFFFTTPIGTDVDALISFNQGDDLIVLDTVYNRDVAFQVHGTYALGSRPVVFQNQYTDTFYFDPDGTGPAESVPFLYTPGSTLAATDFQFV